MLQRRLVAIPELLGIDVPTRAAEDQVIVVGEMFALAEPRQGSSDLVSHRHRSPRPDFGVSTPLPLL